MVAGRMDRATVTVDTGPWPHATSMKILDQQSDREARGISRDIEYDKQEATASGDPAGDLNGNRINYAEQFAPPIHQLLKVVHGDLFILDQVSLEVQL